MSDLFDKLVDSAGHVLGGVDKEGSITTAISGLKHRLAEADRKRKESQLKQTIRDLQTQETQSINALSAQVLALHEAGTLKQPELVSLCRRVDEIRAQIREREADLQRLQPAPTLTAAENRCPRCNAVVPEGAAFCQSCGNRLTAEAAPPPPAPAPAPAQFCVHCGAKLREGAQFCPTCGKSVPPPSSG
jgi:hypothetical protein